MAKFHLNLETGEPGPCKARPGNCPLAAAGDHFDSEVEARKAYESKQGSFETVEEPQVYDKWKPGKKLRTGELKRLPQGAVVRWPSYHSGQKTYHEFEKRSPQLWKDLDNNDASLVAVSYLGGAGGNEAATFVSADGKRLADLPPVEEKAPRKPAAPKWAIISVSNVSSQVRIEHSFPRETTARKKFAELNKYDHLHFAYQLVTMEEAKSRATV